MHAVMHADLLDGLKAERRRQGIDRWDEEWEGVLHLSPPPAATHGRLLWKLAEVLGQLIEARGLGTVYIETGVWRAEKDYRTPDLSVVAAGRDIERDGWLKGGPDLSVEVRSPGDETYEKFPFYAAMGIPELLVVERDTRQLTLFLLRQGSYVAAAPGESGFVASQRFPLAFRTALVEGQVRIEVQDCAAEGRPARTV